MSDDRLVPQPARVQPDGAGVASEGGSRAAEDMIPYYRSLDATAAQGVFETEKRLQAALLATVHTDEE